ncbi:MAG: RHS repeat-associated core domain-containing protein [Pirellulaceae bacterium]|nr:RHS repeat-associated core domain-containing protein [Pirellulaceae bacterium]
MYVHAGPNLIAEYNAGVAANSPAQEYVYADQIDSLVLIHRSDNQKLGVTRNRQWSVTALHDLANGNIVERYAYDMLGKRTIYAANGTTVRTTSSFGNNFGYTNRWHDEESGLVNFRARHYNPLTGEFLSRDPLAFVDGMSVYRGYFPLYGVDPLGLYSEYNPNWPHWHHLLPQAIFEQLNIPGIDINDGEYGYILRAQDHVEKGGIHPTGWDDDWRVWLSKEKGPITKEKVDAQLKKMMGSEKYKDIYANGFKTKRSWNAWKTYWHAQSDIVKGNVIRALIERGARFTRASRFALRMKRLAQKLPRKIPGFGFAIGIVGFGATAQADGVGWAVIEVAADSNPLTSGAYMTGQVGGAVLGLFMDEEDDQYLNEEVGRQLMLQMERESLQDGFVPFGPSMGQCVPIAPRGPDRPPFAPGLAPPLETPITPINPQEEADRGFIGGIMRSRRPY